MTHASRLRALALLTILAGVGAAHSGMTGADPADSTDLTLHAVAEACFAPGTPEEIVARGELQYAWGPRYETTSRWPGTSGQGVHLTYSFPPDTVVIPGSSFGDSATNNNINATLDAQFAGQGGTAQWKSLFRQCFNAWEFATGNTYTEVSDDAAPWFSPGAPGLRGDIRIGMHAIDGPSNLYAYNQYPSNGGDMVIDSSENWGGATLANWRLLRNTVMHEHGHGIGLQHVCPYQQLKLMEHFISINFDGPQLDDFLGGQSLYGDRLEPNNTTLSATDLDSPPYSMTLNVPINIATLTVNAASDSDLFKFVAPIRASVSVSVVPDGSAYLEGPQNGDGSCSAGTGFDALVVQDLQIDILNSAGGVIATRNDNTFGQPETLTNFNLGSVGTFYVRIRSAASAGNTQLYHVSITRRDAGVSGDLNNDHCVNSTDLGILLGAWGPSVTTADLNNDGTVNSSDLALLLGAWGNGDC